MEEKLKIIDEIYQSYLEKDISYLLGIKKTEAFTNLFKLISSQVGNLVNLSELSSTLGISTKTVKDYLWYLQKTFIIEKITPFFRNLRKEITKAPVFYFYDIGLRNYALGEFGNVKSLDKGFIFENFVFNVLKEKISYTPSKIHFWRTKDGAEIDFIIVIGEKIIPIEAKYKQLTKSDVSRSLKSFISKYHPAKILVVNLELNQKIVLNKTKIIFLPFYKLLKIEL